MLLKCLRETARCTTPPGLETEGAWTPVIYFSAYRCFCPRAFMSPFIMTQSFSMLDFMMLTAAIILRRSEQKLSQSFSHLKNILNTSTTIIRLDICDPLTIKLYELEKLCYFAFYIKWQILFSHFFKKVVFNFKIFTCLHSSKSCLAVSFSLMSL